jgi:hypothetical protein
MKATLINWYAKALAAMTLATMVFLSCLAVPTLAQEKLAPAAPSAPDTVGEVPPALVISLSPLGQMNTDIEYLTSVVGQPQIGGLVSMFSGMYGQGLDTKRQIGLLVPLVEGTPKPLLMLPTEDIKALLKMLQDRVGQPDELDDGTMVIAAGANLAYIKQMGQWAAIAQDRESLELAPQDPTASLSGLEKYLFAFRLQMQQVPAETREMLVSQIRQGFDQVMRQGAGADPAAAEAAENAIKQLEQFVNETNELMIGIDIDQENRKLQFDSRFSAIPGSKMAEMYGSQKPIASQFASVIRPDAALYYHAAVSISAAAVEQVKSQIETNLNLLSGVLEEEEKLSEDEKEKIKQLVRRFIDLTVRSLEEGKVDFGALLLADEAQGRFVFGSFVADGNEMAQLVKDFAAEIKGEKDAPEFSFDVDNYKGVSLHRITAKVPAGNEEVQKMFGDTLEVHLGTGPKAVYAAVGTDSLSLMKELIDVPPESSVPVERACTEMKINLLPLLQYAQKVDSNDIVASMIDSLMKSSETGQITLEAHPIPDGQRGFLSIDEEFLRSIGVAATEAQAARQGGGF